MARKRITTSSRPRILAISKALPRGKRARKATFTVAMVLAGVAAQRKGKR